MSEWQPIETAPKTRRSILVYVPENKCTYVVYWDEKHPSWSIFGGGWRSYLTSGGPSHWMPLPDPPKQGEQS
jgi:hypothetical protein